MTVAQLIELLQQHPPEMLVAYACYSEQVLLQPNEIKLFEGCHARPDLWVQNPRPDMPTQTYLLFPGN